MIEFEQIYDLDEGHSDDMIVIQVGATDAEDRFKVRTQYPNIQRWFPDFDNALADAKDRASRNPYLKRVAVYLDQGASWNNQWGNLV